MSILKNDLHLANLILHVRDELQMNKPVLAYRWLEDLEQYIYSEYGDSVAKPIKGDKNRCADCGMYKRKCTCSIPI